MEPRRIIFLENGTSGGGSFESLMLLAEHLDRSRYEPVVVCANTTSHAARLRAAGIRVYVIRDPIYSTAASVWGRRIRMRAGATLARVAPIASSRIDTFTHRSAIAELIAILQRERAALLHCNDHAIRDAYGITAAARVKIPVVSHLRSVRVGAVSPVFAGMLTRAVAKFIANSQYTADVWAAMLHIPVSRIVVISNAITLAPVTSVDIRRELRIPTEAPLIGCIGNFASGKGQEHLVAAFAHIRVRQPDAFGVFVGDGHLRRAIELLADARGIRHALRFTGYRADARGIIAACSVLVVPSETEAFGRTILEGYAAHCPVVATQVGGIPEVLTHEVTGLLVPPADPQALADAVLRFSNDSVLVARCIAAGYDTFATKYGVAAHVAAITKVYDDVLARCV